MKKIYLTIAIVLVMVALSVYGCSSTTSTVTVTQTNPTPTNTSTTPHAPTLISITVTPSYPPDLIVGYTQQFTAAAKYSDGPTANITSQVTWVSSNTNVAAFYPSAGLVGGISTGVVNITAAFSGFVSAPISLTVIPAPTTTTTTTTTTGRTYTGQHNLIFNSASTETLPSGGIYLQPRQTITLSWSADGNLTGYVFDSNQFNNWQQPYGHISVSYWASKSGSQYTYTFTVQNADTYYMVLYDGFPAGSNSIEDYSFTVTVH